MLFNERIVFFAKNLRCFCSLQEIEPLVGCLCLRKKLYLYTLIVDAKLNSTCAMRGWNGNMKHQKKEGMNKQ
ncbi:hypothetical protein HMPREF2140_11610 [Hoylesella buccalis DNF00985]|nr:hypothetical protein HMPREF2140_11610 [Hoylesella buccalis DNF00985]